MSRISKKFAEKRKQNGKAFIPYIMAGDPTLKRTEELFRILEDCGADIIELGVPFSDPLADGPTIQKAAQRSLEGGTTLARVIDFVGSVRRSSSLPIVLMTYYNPVLKYGEERFVHDASSAGADGVIIPDLPPEEASGLIGFSKRRGFDTIFLAAPTSTHDRIKKVARTSSGFIYYVSITGITGAQISIDSSIKSHVDGLKKLTDKPIAVGFGISTPDEASAVAGFADGVIIGSAIVKKALDTDEDFRAYVQALRNAVK